MRLNGGNAYPYRCSQFCVKAFDPLDVGDGPLRRTLGSSQTQTDPHEGSANVRILAPPSPCAWNFCQVMARWGPRMRNAATKYDTFTTLLSLGNTTIRRGSRVDPRKAGWCVGTSCDLIVLPIDEGPQLVFEEPV